MITEGHASLGRHPDAFRLGESRRKRAPREGPHGRMLALLHHLSPPYWQPTRVHRMQSDMITKTDHAHAERTEAPLPFKHVLDHPDLSPLLIARRVRTRREFVDLGRTR